MLRALTPRVQCGTIFTFEKPLSHGYITCICRVIKDYDANHTLFGIGGYYNTQVSSDYKIDIAMLHG